MTFKHHREQVLDEQAYEALYGHIDADTDEDRARTALVESDDFDPFTGAVESHSTSDDQVQLKDLVGQETLAHIWRGRPTLGQTHAAGQSRQHQVRFDAVLDEQLCAYAAENKLSVSEAIRLAVSKLTTRVA